MCGIAGIAKFSGLQNDDRIKQLCQNIFHRGPDNSDIYTDPRVHLCHTRLSILDLSEESNQPFYSNDGRYVLVYNGEIYNYLELKRELEQLGHKFHSTGDTEVVMNAYQAWGKACVQKFNGMWAFVIYDKKVKKLFASRDRFGIKPLYYVLSNDSLIFASEIKALLKSGVKAQLNEGVMTNFLLTNIIDHDDETFFAGIQRLPPGHNFDYDIMKHEFQVTQYYQLLTAIHNVSLGPEPINEFRSLLTDSVRLRLRSDVQVGTCLSGGLDSSSIAAISSNMLKAEGKKMTAFTAVSSDKRNDESPYANAVVAKHDMQAIQIKPGFNAFDQHIADIVYTQEEPFGGPSIVMQYLLMQRVKQAGIKVMLDGQGGDELLLGYPRYCAAYLYDLLKNQGLRSCFVGARYFKQQNAGQSYKSIVKYALATYSASARYFIYRKKLPFLKQHIALPCHLKAYSQSSKNIAEVQALECMSTNLQSMLRFEDKNSMHFGIEARLPFLDHRLVEYSLAMPTNLKINKGWSKWILREAMQSELPESVVWRKNKMGFEAPENIWLKTHGQAMHKQVMTSPLMLKLCHEKKLRDSFFKISLREQWRLYCAALWAERFEVAI